MPIFLDDPVNDCHVILKCPIWSDILLYLIFMFRPALYEMSLETFHVLALGRMLVAANALLIHSGMLVVV